MSSPLIRLLGLARPQAGRLLLAAGAGALATGCGVALLAVSGFLLARASQHPSIVALSVAIVAVRGLSIGRGAFRYAERLTSHDVTFRVLAQVRVAIWRRLEVLAPAGLPAFRTGDLLARLVSDVDATQDLFIRGVTPPLAAGMVGAGAATACALFLAPAGLVLAGGLLIGGIAVPLAGLGAARSAARRSAAARGQFGSAVTDLLGGAADLAAFDAIDFAIGRAAAANRELAWRDRQGAAASGLGSGLATMVAGLTLWGVLILGVAAVGSGALTRVTLAVVTLTALAAFEAVTVLPPAALALSHARASARRIGEVMDAPAPITDPVDPRPLPSRLPPSHLPPSPPRHSPPQPTQAPATHPGSGSSFAVSVRDAQVRYQADGPLALDGVSLDLWPGRRVALVGPNGAGKSTMAAVLLRFRDLDGGSAMLGGHDLACYRADELRTVIGGCPQDQHIFGTTIAGNLRLARPAATADELTAVLSRVGLADWIATLPLGQDTEVGPAGAEVSGGQRQRIVLARALLADPVIMILDEPAAHLDLDARRSLTADLLSATAGRSTLLITHDLDGLDQVDEIIVLDKGKVIQRGTHSQLRTSSGPYRRMLSGTT
jgi:ATP-binding cassette, subfamily C, bacterial CydC